MNRRALLLLALAACLAALVVSPGTAAAQVCVPGSPLPGCPTPPPPTPPPPGPPPPSGGAPGEEGRPPPAEPSACAPQRRANAGFVGLVSEDIFAGGPNYRSCALNSQVEAGVGLVRQTFDWAAIEPSRGRYEFSYYDAYMAALAQHGVRVLPVLFNPPRFRSSRPRRGAKRGTYPPRRYRDIGRFGAVLVRRYGPRGSFWRSRPDLPKRAIRAWQIWNEPHLRVYWPRGPNPRQYTRMLRAAHKGIRRADRRAEVLTAALSQSSLSRYSLSQYISGMYRAGARSAFETLAINPYGKSPARAHSVVRGVRRLMNRRGDRRGRIWVTEFGWATGGKSKKFRVSTGKQARWVARLLRSLHRKRRGLRLRGAVYYNWRDADPYPPLFQDFFGLHTGLLDTDGSPKPAFWTFRRVARRLR